MYSYLLLFWAVVAVGNSQFFASPSLLPPSDDLWPGVPSPNFGYPRPGCPLPSFGGIGGYDGGIEGLRGISGGWGASRKYNARLGLNGSRQRLSINDAVQGGKAPEGTKAAQGRTSGGNLSKTVPAHEGGYSPLGTRRKFALGYNDFKLETPDDFPVHGIDGHRLSNSGCECNQNAFPSAILPSVANSGFNLDFSYGVQPIVHPSKDSAASNCWPYNRLMGWQSCILPSRFNQFCADSSAIQGLTCLYNQRNLSSHQLDSTQQGETTRGASDEPVVSGFYKSSQQKVVGSPAKCKSCSTRYE